MTRKTYTMAAGLLVLAGLAAAIYLTILHVRVHTDPSYHSVCAISKGVNCETVAESRYSVFLGVPVAVWGVLGYVAMGLALVWATLEPEDEAPLGAMALLTTFSVGTSLVLGYISLTKIASVCIFCCFTYVVNAILFVITLLTLRRRVWAAVARLIRVALGRIGYTLALGGAGLAVLALLVACYPHYWEREGTLKPVESQKASAPSTAGDGALTTGVDDAGHPWYGARKPTVVIHEYSDYQCPYCAMFHGKVRALVERYRGRVRLVHHNFPLDGACNPLLGGQRFHPDACRRARLAICALRKGLFWKANDWLFSHRKNSFTNERFAREVGLDPAWLKECLSSGKTEMMLKRDLDRGMALGLEGTPTYVVDGKKYWYHELEKALPSMLR